MEILVPNRSWLRDNEITLNKHILTIRRALKSPLADVQHA